MPDDPGDDKRKSLRDRGTLNPRPDAVRDPLFDDADPFFDRRDLVQVKYEMLRRSRIEGQSVSSSAARFGFSRVSFYQALRALQAHGIAGLMPVKRGPRSAHKLSDDVITFLQEKLEEDPSLEVAAMVELVRTRFARTVHRRSVERALARQKKKLR